MSDDKLHDAMFMVRALLPLAKGYVAAHPGIESTKRIIDDADKMLTVYKDVLDDGEKSGYLLITKARYDLFEIAHPDDIAEIDSILTQLEGK